MSTNQPTLTVAYETISRLLQLAPQQLIDKGFLRIAYNNFSIGGKKQLVKIKICPFCNEGAKPTLSGSFDFTIKNGVAQYHCSACMGKGDTKDNMDVFAKHFGLDVDKDRFEICRRACETFDIPFETESTTTGGDPFKNAPPLTDRRTATPTTISFSGGLNPKTLDDLKNLSLDDLVAHGILEHANNFNAQNNHGLCCPLCGSGNGDNHTGAGTFDDNHKFYCHACKNDSTNGRKLDPIDLYMRVRDISSFKDACKDMVQEFLLNQGTRRQNTTGKALPPAKDKNSAKNAALEAEYLKLIAADVAQAQANFDQFPADARRGLSDDTLRHFHFGYLPNWVNTRCRAEKNVGLYVNKITGQPKQLPPPSRRIIIPTSTTHFNAVMLPADRTPANKDFWKQHAGNIELFNEEALDYSKRDVIVVVEGEIDAASIWQACAGNIAVVAAIGGNKNLLLKTLDAHNVKGKKFLVLFDNDKGGQDNAKSLVDALIQRGYPAVSKTFDSYLCESERAELADANGKLDANQILQVAGAGLLESFIEVLIRDSQPEFQKALPILPVVNEQPATTVVEADRADKYAPLFEGLEPIKVSVGAIMQVAESNLKPYLETLFVEKNFVLFVNSIAPRNQIQADNPDLVYSSEVETQSLTNVQIETALTWLVRQLAPFYHGDFNAMRRMLCKHLGHAQTQGAQTYFQDLNFIRKVLDGVTVEPYSFEDKFKRELIAFADHSEEVFQSLARFDYQRTSQFLKKTLTDVTCAELLVDVQHEFLRFDIDQGTWYWWNKNHWQAVLAKTNARLYELWTPLARKSRIFAEYQHFKITCEAEDFSICNEITKTNLPAFEKQKRLAAAVKSAGAKVKEANKLEVSRSIESFLEQASGLPEIKIRTEQLDQHDYLFNCANCTIDLRTMETFPARREDLITLATDTIYDPTATCPEWEAFIKQAIPDADLRDWFQRYCGYCLSGLTVEQIFAFVHGEGGAGKTTCLNVIAGVLGEYAKVFPPELITENSKQKDGNEPNPLIATWRNARLIRSDETKKNKRLDEAAVKRYSGSDRLVARELHKPPFEYDPHFKIIIDGNHTLNINDVHDNSLRRRLRIVPFINPPAPEDIDVMLTHKLSTPQARSAILNWCLLGWTNYQKRGLSDIPAAMQLAQDEFYSANDTISEFLEDCSCEIGDKNRAKYQVAVMAVWRQFNDWRKVNPHTPSYKKNEFVNAVLQSLKNDGVEVRDIGHQKHFVGFTINFNLEKATE